MPSSTFTNLPDEKRQRIEAALLNEFSNHTLATAQVARIVKDAQIARGPFTSTLIISRTPIPTCTTCWLPSWGAGMI
ncbi:hypothetical protein AAEZ42_05215 [Limosilactobacillus fermentum]